MNYLIVGGNSGIANTIALNLLNNGHHVITCGREAWNGESHQNHTHHVLNGATEVDQIDLPDELNGLVYAPGTINLKPFRGLKDDDFLHDFEVNALGAVRAVRHAQSALKKSDNASVVLFSTVAVTQGMPFHTSVAMSKGAVEGLTKSLAAEFAPKIRVNAVAPSLSDTPLASSLLSNDKRRESSAERHPLKRVGTSEDIANAALYLLGEQSSWVSGQILHVDGGMSKLRV
ncbi:MAG: SDR family oxidoreductase [Oceanospirillaceae bacterium]|nr:SDR family oxidoreductase [Oceanospirillaceae bacterium]